ncbi:MAG: hypothetical protein AB1813_03475 [Verrucomicrobiota bacterium]
MKFRRSAFNIILLLLMLPGIFGCKTTEEKRKSKEATTLRLHLETNVEGGGRETGVSILRANPILVNVQRDHFLDEGDVEQAFVVPALGGFAIKVQFNRHGTLVLDNYTTSYKGKRIGVFSQFGDARWLAAPVINQRIVNGQLVFTPDASYEEAERIVRGLNNVAKELQKKSKF